MDILAHAQELIYHLLELILQLHAITGVRYDRCSHDEQQLFQLHKPGQQVRLKGLDFSVPVAWFYLKREG